MINRASAKELTDIIVPWLQAVGLVAAGIFAIFQYSKHLDELKVERTIGYVTRGNSGELLASITKLSTQYQRQYVRFQATHPPSLPAEKITADYYDFVLRDVLMYGNDKGMESDLNSVIGFLSDGVICTQSGLCDEALVRSNLGDFGKGTIESYRPYFCFLRKLYNEDSLAGSVMKFYDPATTDDGCKAYSINIENTLVSSGAVSPPVTSTEESH